MLNGGNGDDTYFIDVSTDVIEADSGGIDTVNFFDTTGTYTLAADLEHINLLGTAAINGTGNALNNIITGNAGNNIVDGGAGNDILIGSDGKDTLDGGLGDDILDGGAGSDGMWGGLGSDIYLISLPEEHTIAEILDTGATGIDEVRFDNVIAGTAFNASVDPTLKLYGGDTGIESVVIGTGLNVIADTSSTANLNIDASAVLNALNITGNNGNNFLAGTAFGDTINGGVGDDVINGAAGNDLMNGENGNDYYIVSSHAAAEIADTGTTGVDTVIFTSLLAGDTFKVFAGDIGIEEIVIGTVTMNSFYGFISIINGSDIQLNVDASASQNGLTISDNAGNNTIHGSVYNDVISDSNGNDTVFGGAGNDSLNSRGGSNVFVFDSALDSTTNVDNINFFISTAFNFGYSDTLRLDHNIFSALNLGALSGNDFVVGAAVDTTDHILKIGNAVYYDADGSGSIAPIEFVTLTGHTVLTAADFIIV